MFPNHKNTTLLRTVLLLQGFLLIGLAALAQGNVSGALRDERQTPVPFATIAVLAQRDSTPIRSTFSDERGAFTLKNIPYGHYLLLVTSEGFTPLHTQPFELTAATADLGTLVLAHSVKSMTGVIVRATKPVLEKRPDRFVMNMAASTFQSSDLLNIFRSLPFMDVDGESVAINGKSNVLVLIDGVPRPKESLGSIFQSMTGQDVERIEFITNPSAQYDGTADAVINIITKKGQLQGLTGYARATGSQGIYANGNGGVNITVRQKKIVFNGMLNFNGGNFLARNYGYRILTLQNRNVVLNETPHDLYKTQTFAGVLSLEYALSRNHTLAAQVDGNFRHMLDGTRWHNRIEFSNAVGGKIDSVLVALQRAHSRTNIVNYSLSYRGKLDSNGKKTLTAAFVYTPLNKRTMNEMQYQNIEDATGNLLHKLPVIRNTNPSHSSIAVGQADAQLRFENKWQLNTGVKANFSRLESNPYQEALTGSDDWVLIPEYSFRNVYTERILAAYAGVQKSVNDFSLNAAVRAENTRMEVEGVYIRNFTDLLPSLLLQQKFSKTFQMALSYKRSINRPSFVELTPYRIYLDNYTILQGNPGLRPQHTDAVNINANLRDKLFIDLDYSGSNNSFSQLPIQKGDTTVWQVVNLNAKYYATTLTYNYRLTSAWQGNLLVRGTYYKTDGLLGNEFVSSDGFALLLGVNSTYSLPNDMKLDIGINYRTPRPYGLALSRKRSFVRLALKGNLFQKRLQYTITAADIFKDDISGFNLRTARLVSRFYTFNDSRRLSIGLVYNFGKSTVKAAQDRRLENEELLNRAN